MNSEGCADFSAAALAAVAMSKSVGYSQIATRSFCESILGNHTGTNLSYRWKFRSLRITRSESNNRRAASVARDRGLVGRFAAVVEPEQGGWSTLHFRVPKPRAQGRSWSSGENIMIRKLASGEYRLYSRKINSKTGKRRNLGTFKSRAAAEKHEPDVQYFKRH